jgi:hypothetical protein
MTLAEWNDATGQDEHSFALASLSGVFVNAAADDYNLLADSPAVSLGLASIAPLLDISGNPRPTGVGVDTGAYEYVP